MFFKDSLLSDSTKPLPEAILTYHHLIPVISERLPSEETPCIGNLNIIFLKPITQPCV